MCHLVASLKVFGLLFRMNLGMISGIHKSVYRVIFPISCLSLIFPVFCGSLGLLFWSSGWKAGVSCIRLSCALLQVMHMSWVNWWENRARKRSNWGLFYSLGVHSSFDFRGRPHSLRVAGTSGLQVLVLMLPGDSFSASSRALSVYTNLHFQMHAQGYQKGKKRKKVNSPLVWWHF